MTAGLCFKSTLTFMYASFSELTNDVWSGKESTITRPVCHHWLSRQEHQIVGCQYGSVFVYTGAYTCVI